LGKYKFNIYFNVKIIFESEEDAFIPYTGWLLTTT